MTALPSARPIRVQALATPTGVGRVTLDPDPIGDYRRRHI
jgi:hypothetical protein